MPKLYILPWLEKVFKLVVFRLLENSIVSQKLNVDLFTFYSRRFLSSPTTWREITRYPPSKVFFWKPIFSPTEREGEETEDSIAELTLTFHFFNVSLFLTISTIDVFWRIFILVCQYERTYSGTPKKEIYLSLQQYLLLQVVFSF